jgi:putative flippase GtrA
MTSFVRFLLTGGLAALVNLESRYMLNKFMSFEAAVALAFVFGVSTAYVLAKVFVFAASGQAISNEFGRFLVVNLVALVVVFCVSVGLATEVFPAINFSWHADSVAHFIGVISPVAFSYVAHRRYTFRRVGIVATDKQIVSDRSQRLR